MSAKIPKLILKVEFLNDFNVKFSLMNLHPYYNAHLSGNKIYAATDTDFIIYEGNTFKINDGIISLPCDNCMSINQSTIKFVSDKRRYQVLNEMKDALLNWSGSKYWKGNDDLCKVSEMQYRKNLWILY